MKLAAALAPLALLAACYYTPTHGTVIGKTREPGALISGIPACWRLNLQNEQGQTGGVCVTQHIWEQTPIGSYYRPL